MPAGARSFDVPLISTPLRVAFSLLRVKTDCGASLSAPVWAASVPPQGSSKFCASPRQIVTDFVSYALPDASSQVSVQASFVPFLCTKGRVDGVMTQLKVPFSPTTVL